MNCRCRSRRRNMQDDLIVAVKQPGETSGRSRLTRTFSLIRGCRRTRSRSASSLMFNEAGPGHHGRAWPGWVYESVCVRAGGMDDTVPPVIPGFTPVPLPGGGFVEEPNSMLPPPLPLQRQSRRRLARFRRGAGDGEAIRKTGAMKFFRSSLLSPSAGSSPRRRRRLRLVMRGFIVPDASAAMARWFAGTAIAVTPTAAIGAVGGAFATEVS